MNELTVNEVTLSKDFATGIVTYTDFAALVTKPQTTSLVLTVNVSPALYTFPILILLVAIKDSAN